MTKSFLWAQPVPPSWQADLDQLAPGERVSRLMIQWLAGQPYAPVQRWAVWEILPAAVVGEIMDEEEKLGITDSLLQGLWQDLRGPDPRTAGRWVKDRAIPEQFGGKRWVSRSLVSRVQWDLHQQTGGLPLLCWIIEGDRGGHSWQFGPFERGFLLALGTEPELIQAMADAWPNPGDQPYADYDGRVFQMLVERDALRSWRRGLSWDSRHYRTHAGLVLADQHHMRAQAMGERMMRWLDNQVSAAVSDIPRTLLPQWSEFATVPEPPEQDEESLLKNFVTEDRPDVA